ncbi:MAG: tetratricopeptide repeat protein [Bacteroides sp.]|nr:tetratricopeptide repeat protein [Prevotella sp.]MCM1407790.1 tetratricopeptide repeat protein [Treponema brennaborense]MCM1468862.1 tetratricopeptide repeat protein [Bacteroides sp.]
MIFLILILVVGICFLFFFVVKSFIAPKQIGGIKKLIKQGKYSSAVKLAKRMITKDPRDFHARYYLGKAYLLDGKPELALMEYKTVNKNAIFDKELPETDFRKESAQLYSKFNQNEEALKEYLLLSKLEPNNADHFYNAGKIFETREKTEQAMSYYQKALTLNKRHVKAHAAMGLMLYRVKQFSEAKKEINTAISLSPETYSSYYYLGKIYKENKDYPAAVAAFEKSLRDPEFKQRALMERGACFVAAKSIDKAIIEYDRAIKASKNESSQETLYARYFLAACYERNRDIDKAIVQWEKIYEKNRSFKDVPAKLTEYRHLQANDNMKEYLTCNSETFIAICTKLTQTYNLTVQDISATKFGCRCSAVENKDDNWRNVRQQVFMLLFYREPDLIEDSVLRTALEEIKKRNISKCIICTSAGFTGAAVQFAENRPFELVNKDGLEQLLSKITL